MKDFIQEPHTDPSSDNPCNGSIEREEKEPVTVTIKMGKHVYYIKESEMTIGNFSGFLSDITPEITDQLNHYSVDK